VGKMRNGEWRRYFCPVHGRKRIKARRHRYCSDGIGTVSGGDGAVATRHLPRSVGEQDRGVARRAGATEGNGQVGRGLKQRRPALQLWAGPGLFFSI
jgi:hypothetical protein